MEFFELQKENKNLKVQRGLLIFAIAILLLTVVAQHFFLSESKELITRYETLVKNQKYPILNP